MGVKYYVIAYSDDGGKTFDGGKPQVCTIDELDDLRQKARRATDGNWDVLVITTFEIAHSA